MMPHNIFYEGYDLEGLRRACRMNKGDALTPILERHTLVKEIVYAKYRSQLRKDVKKAITQLKRKAKAKVKPKTVKKAKKPSKRAIRSK